MTYRQQVILNHVLNLFQDWFRIHSQGSDTTKYHYSSIQAYLDEDADVEVPIDHHEYFLELGGTFAKRVALFMKYEEYYKTKYPMILEW